MHNNNHTAATLYAIAPTSPALSEKARETKYSCCYHHRFSFDKFPCIVKFKITNQLANNSREV
jgi:hypothetical protein